MDPRLQAGLELQLEKQAQQEYKSSLSGVLGQYFKQAAPAHELTHADRIQATATDNALVPAASRAQAARAGATERGLRWHEDPASRAQAARAGVLAVTGEDPGILRTPKEWGEDPGATERGLRWHEDPASRAQAARAGVLAVTGEDPGILRTPKEWGEDPGLTHADQIDPRRKGPQGRFPDTEINPEPQQARGFAQAAPGLAAKTGPSPLRRAWDWTSARHPVYQAGKGAIEGAAEGAGRATDLLRKDIDQVTGRVRGGVNRAAAKTQSAVGGAMSDVLSKYIGVSRPLNQATKAVQGDGRPEYSGTRGRGRRCQGYRFSGGEQP